VEATGVGRVGLTLRVIETNRREWYSCMRRVRQLTFSDTGYGAKSDYATVRCYDVACYSQNEFARYHPDPAAFV